MVRSSPCERLLVNAAAVPGSAVQYPPSWGALSHQVIDLGAQDLSSLSADGPPCMDKEGLEEPHEAWQRFLGSSCGSCVTPSQWFSAHIGRGTLPVATDEAEPWCLWASIGLLLLLPSQ